MAHNIRNASNYRRAIDIPYAIAGASASATAVIYAPTADRALRMFRVVLVPGGNVAASATDYWQIQITDGTAVLASWSTLNSANGALTSGVPVDLVIATMADCLPTKVLDVALVKTGTPASFPASFIVVGMDEL